MSSAPWTSIEGIRRGWERGESLEVQGERVVEARGISDGKPTNACTCGRGVALRSDGASMVSMSVTCLWRGQSPAQCSAHISTYRFPKRALCNDRGLKVERVPPLLTARAEAAASRHACTIQRLPTVHACCRRSHRRVHGAEVADGEILGHR